MLQIPLRNDVSNYTFKCELDGVSYTLNIRWNERIEFWSMDLLTADEENIVLGIPLLMGVDLLGRFQDSRLPPGILFMVNQLGTNAEATASNLYVDTFLMYAEASDLE